jgi:hypothetical protein
MDRRNAQLAPKRHEHGVIRGPRTRDKRARDRREWQDVARNWRDVTNDDLED